MAALDTGSSLRSSAVRSVYLVTDSRADLSKFPNRRDFAEAVVTSLEKGSAKVKHCTAKNHFLIKKKILNLRNYFLKRETDFLNKKNGS